MEELPGANTQGETPEEVRENQQEAIALALEGSRILAEEALLGLAEEALLGRDVIRGPITLQAA